MITIKKDLYPDRDPHSPYYGEYTYHFVRGETYMGVTYYGGLAEELRKAFCGEPFAKTIPTLKLKIDDYKYSLLVDDKNKVWAVIFEETLALTMLEAYNELLSG